MRWHARLGVVKWLLSDVNVTYIYIYLDPIFLKTNAIVNRVFSYIFINLGIKFVWTTTWKLSLIIPKCNLPDTYRIVLILIRPPTYPSIHPFILPLYQLMSTSGFCFACLAKLIVFKYIQTRGILKGSLHLSLFLFQLNIYIYHLHVSNKSMSYNTKYIYTYIYVCYTVYRNIHGYIQSIPS